MNELQVADKLDLLHEKLKQYPTSDMPLRHVFTPGLYARQIFMPAGSLVISRIHKYEHPFVVSQGRVLVWHLNGSVLDIMAPYMGITKPGAQRVLYILQDTIWTTFHVTNLTDPDQIVENVTMTPDKDSITIRDLAMKQIKETSS